TRPASSNGVITGTSSRSGRNAIARSVRAGSAETRGRRRPRRGCVLSTAVLCPAGGGATTTAERGRPIVGREGGLASLNRFLEGGTPRAFVLTGDPGVGKTTLWEAGVELARRRGLRVLSARGSGAETQLASAALIDLLDGVGDESLGDLPPPQLRAL